VDSGFVLTDSKQQCVKLLEYVMQHMMRMTYTYEIVYHMFN